ncbi:UBR1 [Sanghuangporus sanghuang]
MSRLSSLLSFAAGSTMSPQNRTTDGLTRLRFTLETLPGSKKYIFMPATRCEILSELYETFWGSHGSFFLPNAISFLPVQVLLSEVQTRYGFHGAGGEPPIIPGRSCGHIFTKGESCYRCKDCALDDSCVMCARCFHATKHEGHNVSFYIAQQSGGCCDCGDQEAWRYPIGCRYHPPASESDAIFAPENTPRASTRSLNFGATQATAPNRPHVPPELWDSMSRTVAYVLDFILDTLDYSPDETLLPTTEQALTDQPSADPLKKDLYAIVVWNDDKHSFDEVIRHLADTCGCSVEEASNHASKIDEQGRDVVEMNNYSPRLLEIAQAIARIDLGVTVRRAYDTFREQIAGVLIEWLLDLTKCRLLSDTMVIREVIATEFISPRKRDIHSLLQNPECAKVLHDINGPSRLDWMFLYHTRLWKKPRLSLKEIYVSILTLSHEHKITLAVHYASVYHWIIDSYLLVDREAETSIKYFALQLFTVPSVAAHIVQGHQIISRLLSIITSFFTNQIRDKRVAYPPDPRAVIDVDTFPFKSKRFMPVFSDLRYIAHNQSVQQLIAHDLSYIEQFASTCKLFMCINPNKRAAESHVEYETDAWISVFNVTLSLSRVIKVYGEAFAVASPLELVGALHTVIDNLMEVCNLADPRIDRSKFQETKWHGATVGEKTVGVVEFDIMEGWVSFHHSLHWLLAELLKHVNLLSDEALQPHGYESLRHVIKCRVSYLGILTIIDFPLRVLAVVAQIRTGLWVRNGFVIRGQLMHYRDFMLRELCYDQDLFIMQSAFVMLDDPDLVLISIIDRFNLIPWFNGSIVSPVYEGSQLFSMVEEVLYVFITILSENANAGQIDMRSAVRREIIHALAVGPCPYTDLVKRVAERMVDDVCFDHVLREVANFRAPVSTMDTGIYELKDECFDEINPFFYHYSRNKREEVETILKTRLKKKTGATDPVVVPRSIGIRHGPYQVLSNVFGSKVLLHVMFFCINNILLCSEKSKKPAPSSEPILDQALHLVMLGIVERGRSFAELLATCKPENHKGLVDVLCALEHHPGFKPHKSRVDWILNRLEEHIQSEVQSKRRVVDKANGPADPEEARKRAAKARQEAIMKQMKAQQSSFAMNFEEDFEDEEDESNKRRTEERPVSFGTCIVCQEDLNSSKGFGALGLIQPSRLVRKHPEGQIYHVNEALSTPESLDRPVPPRLGTQFPPEDAELRDAQKKANNQLFDGFPSHYTKFGLVGSVCSHMMHLDCFQVYNVSIKQRHRAQGQRNHPESIARKEYLCPLCKSLGNVVLPVSLPATAALNSQPFSDWVRSVGITILKSRPDPQLDSLQAKTGTGEFVFWAAQDTGYLPYAKSDQSGNADWHKMLDTLIVVTKSFSQQTRHLRERPEPELTERGAGLYLPEDLVGYTLGMIEIAQRGMGDMSNLLVDRIPDSTYMLLRGMIANLTKLAALHFRIRPDEGRDAIRQAIVKRLLPEWSRTSLTSLPYPLLLRDPLTILVETAAVAPEMLRHALIPLYYACLARIVIGMIYVLNKCRPTNAVPIHNRRYEALFGDLRTFCMSVVRQSPVIEHTAEIVYDSFGDGRMEKLLYSFTLPFLRRAAILCRAMLPRQFPAPECDSGDTNEYSRLLQLLGIPPLAELPNHDTLKTLLFGWCSHYGQSHAASQLNCGVYLEFCSIYRIVELPHVLDTLFGEEDRLTVCKRCKTVPVDAAICLACGAVCCMQSHCCREFDTKERGECNLHTRECGGAVGLFFLVKRCSLLYLYAGNGTFVQAPYLDVHGEMDVSMRRGRRQYLHFARWEEVRKAWLNHGIPTLIARKLESTVDSGGWETL